MANPDFHEVAVSAEMVTNAERHFQVHLASWDLCKYWYYLY